MSGPHLYDAELQMFVATPRELDARRLRFLRWLAEHGRLEHDVVGPASGPLDALAWGQDRIGPRPAA